MIRRSSHQPVVGLVGRRLRSCQTMGGGKWREVEGEKAKNMWLWSSRDLLNSTAQYSIDLKYFPFWSPGCWVSWEAKPSLRMERGQEATLSLNP